MDEQRPLRIGVIAGEESGQLLAADIIRHLEQQVGRPISLCGVGGSALAERGLNSLFDPEEIALMGISAVIKALPRLMRRIGQTADHLVAENPDIVLLVDSPDFSLRVARRAPRVASLEAALGAQGCGKLELVKCVAQGALLGRIGNHSADGEGLTAKFGEVPADGLLEQADGDVLEAETDALRA